MANPIPLCEPTLDGSEGSLLQECLASTFVSSVGPFVERFEREFAAAVGAPHAVACASGTAAIHLALHALGVGRGDLVLCSDFTFIASANPAAHLGAEVAFIDSEMGSWNLDPALLAQALDDLVREGRRPKAVIAVHILGQPADLGPVVEACARHGVPLVEDAAEALGATYDAGYPAVACAGRQVGTIGVVGCFSFNGNKIITTGGGGMITTADPVLAHTLKHLSTQAKQPGLAFIHDSIGFNYRMPNLNAALGLAQLASLSRFITRKRAIADTYRAACASLGWTFHPELPGTAATRWLPSVLIGPRRDAVLAELTTVGIGARPLWLPVADQPCYRGARRWGGAVARRLAEHGLSLPCSSHLTSEDQTRVIAALRAAMAET